MIDTHDFSDPEDGDKELMKMVNSTDKELINQHMGNLPPVDEKNAADADGYNLAGSHDGSM